MKKSEDYYYYRTKYGCGTFNVGDLVLTITSYTAKFQKNGFLHRLDGPALHSTYGSKSDIMKVDGKFVRKWHINGYDVTKEIYPWAKETDIDLYNLSDDDKLLIKIVWADYDGK